MTYEYEITGCVAHSRIAPLLPANWTDITNNESLSDMRVPQFLWENAPRPETKSYRDHVLCYSHLPNGLSILDSKWSLARLLCRQESKDYQESKASILPTHCFRGKAGFRQFLNDVGLLKSDNATEDHPFHLKNIYPDLLSNSSTTLICPQTPPNVWVIKDDRSNGAGGIWMLSSSNVLRFLKSYPLVEEHKYVAQKYAWPPTLYGGRKCHVRVYGLFTSDHRAFVHKRCFLHVANEKFADNNYDQDSVHITNCCANSHDMTKFAGEICADLSQLEFTHTECGKPIIPLSTYYESIAASIELLAQQAFPFLKGGTANGGFEYLGLDFILSDGGKAYLLEVNAPPSQDTATGLNHAEDLHNVVLSDLIRLWVLPVVSKAAPVLGGWRCVYTGIPEDTGILPSKAVILNKIRWAIFERKIIKQEDETKTLSPAMSQILTESLAPLQIANYARQQFPFFVTYPGFIFMENAGGAQVPFTVIDAMQQSLSYRNRSVVGSEQQQQAIGVAKKLMGCSREQSVYFGANATTLLKSLASHLSQAWAEKDIVVIATENHLANVTPWTEAANRAGCTVLWWSLASTLDRFLSEIQDSWEQVKLVALSHASNILGHVRDIQEIVTRIHRCCPNAQVIIDGVATIPHVHITLEKIPSIWYVVSCHKWFGPHLGILVGPSYVEGLESGTVNYEACAGFVGLADYLLSLSTFEAEQSPSQNLIERKDRREAISGMKLSSSLTSEVIFEAYRRIAVVEGSLFSYMMERLQSSSYKVHILGNEVMHSSKRLPIISFRHDTIPSEDIVTELAQVKVASRQGQFLSTERFQSELGFESVVRLSLAHYNTALEVENVINTLTNIVGW
jgi:selenocysteine lyase/cysteine desulfurase